MAILGNFEITILTPRNTTSKLTGLPEQQWLALTEHYPPKFDATRTDFCEKYIGVPTLATSLAADGSAAWSPQADQQSPFAHHTLSTELDDLGGTGSAVESKTEEEVEFAIDYKVHCGFTFNDSDEADLIVFRTFLDDERIGSGFVKRDRWERSGTYRVRKRGKRMWLVDPLGALEDTGWVQRKWMFGPGHHGTLKVEAWRETQRPQHYRQGMFQTPSNAAWTPFGNQFPDDGIVDLTWMSDDTSAVEFVSKVPRVKKTRKIDLWPMATFVFEYRTEETLKTMGIVREPEHEHVADDEHEEDSSVQTKSTHTVKRSPQIPRRRQSYYDISEISSSSNASATVHATTSISTSLPSSDPEFNTLLNPMRGNYLENAATDLSAEVGSDPYTPMKKQSAKENDSWQDHGVEIVDLTMED